MTLEHVVLPAPLGPISPRISPSLMSKLTWSSAVTPPNRMVTSSTSSSALRTSPWRGLLTSAVSGIDGLPLELLDLGLGAQSSSGASWWQQTLWSHVHDQHQRQAEDQQAPVAQRSEALGQVGDQGATDDRAPAVAGATDDHRGHEQHRQQDQEAVGVDVATLTRRQHGTGQATERSAEGEGQQLVAERRHPHHLGGVLVLAGGLPGTADPALLDQVVGDQHDQEDRQHQPVVRDRV